MTAMENEDELLHSVALKNASSILIARRRAEQRNEDYLAEAQRLSHTGSFGWTVTSGEIHWSAETFRIFQYPPTTKPTVELVYQRTHPDDLAQVRQTIARASQDGKDFDHEYRLLMPDGTIKHVHVVAHVSSPEAGAIEYVGAVMDVTGQHEAKAALRRAFDEIKKSEDRLRLVIDTIPGMVWSARPDGRVDYVNERWVEYSGLHWEDGGLRWEDSGGEAGFGSAIHPDDVAAVAAGWRMALGAGRPAEQELRLRAADGQYRWFLSRALPLRDESGHIVKWYGTITDIEDQKRAAEALRQAQADLAHVSRVTTIGELTASLSHEVNQPIAAVVMNANACVRWLSSDPPNLDEARATAKSIVQDGTRAGDIISRIRRVFRKGAPEREPVDANEIIRELIVLLRNEAARYAVSVRTELAADLPQVLGDRVLLQQVMMNLVINGIDAMKELAGTRELVIRSQRAEREQIVVSVSDTGVGLPAHQAHQIFDAFVTTKAHGTGMGLSISRSILESHGGRLWATGNVPRGARFHFTLPCAVDSASRPSLRAGAV